MPCVLPPFAVQNVAFHNSKVNAVPPRPPVNTCHPPSVAFSVVPDCKSGAIGTQRKTQRKRDCKSCVTDVFFFVHCLPINLFSYICNVIHAEARKGVGVVADIYGKAFTM